MGKASFSKGSLGILLCPAGRVIGALPHLLPVIAELNGV